MPISNNNSVLKGNTNNAASSLIQLKLKQSINADIDHIAEKSLEDIDLAMRAFDHQKYMNNIYGR